MSAYPGKSPPTIAVRVGIRRGPRSTQTAIVAITSGMPTAAKEKKPNPPVPVSAAASDTITLTGLPVRVSSAPARAVNASGMSTADGGRLVRAAMATSIVSSAGAGPLGVIRAEVTADSASAATSNRVGPGPVRRMRRSPAQAVRPALSSASLTTNSDAMNATIGSPNPATTRSAGSTPLAYRASMEMIATASTGSRLQTNSTMTPATMSRLAAASVMSGRP